MTRAIALALGVDEDIFVSRVDKSFWNLRVLGYEAVDENTAKERVSGIGQHTG